MHGQDPDHRVAGRDAGGVEVGDMAVDVQALTGGPLDGAGVAGDEPGGHYAALMV